MKTTINLTVMLSIVTAISFTLYSFRSSSIKKKALALTQCSADGLFSGFCTVTCDNGLAIGSSFWAGCSHCRAGLFSASCWCGSCDALTNGGIGNDNNGNNRFFEPVEKTLSLEFVTLVLTSQKGKNVISDMRLRINAMENNNEGLYTALTNKLTRELPALPLNDKQEVNKWLSARNMKTL